MLQAPEEDVAGLAARLSVTHQLLDLRARRAERGCEMFRLFVSRSCSRLSIIKVEQPTASAARKARAAWPS